MSRSPEEVRTLTAYLEGEVTASERAAIETKLQESAEARRTLAQLERVRELLSAPAVKLESIDLASRVRTRERELGPVVRTRPRRWQNLAYAGLTASLCAIALVLWSPHLASLRPGSWPPRKEDEGLRPKSNGAQLEGARWAGVHVFRVAGQAAPEPLGARLKSGDGLVFTYTNLGAHPFRYLMIFAVDASDQVHWFYPAYESVGEDPVSIPIAGGLASAALGELVQHDFAEGPLFVYALFTNVPARVLQVEAWLREQRRPSNEAPFVGGLLQRFDTRIER
ncbi:MAG TPA: hypothetical protein VFQ61_36070 [Polyangiaceae bacterium]|nr:hypothetical protein [Polyangiaceae bacterium]